MNRLLAFLTLVCMAGCAASTSAPSSSTSSPRPKPSMCALYIGGWGACIGNCSAARAHGTAAIPCMDTCTPGAPGEPPVCQKQPGCEAMQQADAESAYASCMAQCNSMPVECR